MYVQSDMWARIAVCCLTLWSGNAAFTQTTNRSVAAVAKEIVGANEKLWRSFDRRDEGLSSRSLFSYALALCEARQRPERFERIFALAEQMQDRDPKSKTFGNLRWYWRDAKVMDANAVDFCMRGGALIWLKHREFLPARAQEMLRGLLDFGGQGCQRHKVGESYSNIAIMNAGNLILLGEALGKPAFATEGYARLERVFRYTAEAGIHEFDSPTYTGVDVEGLGLIETFCREEAGRKQARRLLELFWTDIALNWFEPAQRLAGAQSRTYDFLYGHGYLDTQLALNRWINRPLAKDPDVLYSVEARWHSSDSIRNLSRHFPRLMRQSWGKLAWQSRTHFICEDITLSCSASSYGGRMDMPLTADLPGDWNSVRCYFIADARGDPYGKKKIAAGPHEKAFHLDPFWMAAQRQEDVLALVVYRSKDIPTNAALLESNFVMPISADEFWVGRDRVTFVKGESQRLEIKDGAPVILRQGSAALGIKMPWARQQDGAQAQAALVYDGNEFGAVRLTVTHGAQGVAQHTSNEPAGAVLWLRSGSGLKDETAFQAWFASFAEAGAEVQAGAGRLKVHAAGKRGTLEVNGSAPWSDPGAIDPQPTRAVLEFQGEDIGARILRASATAAH